MGGKARRDGLEGQASSVRPIPGLRWRRCPIPAQGSPGPAPSQATIEKSTGPVNRIFFLGGVASGELGVGRDGIGSTADMTEKTRFLSADDADGRRWRK